MPTAYTAYIDDGEITNAKDFILLCTRAFGVSMDIRDEPLSVPTPINFEPDISFDTEQIKKYEAEKERILNMSDEEFHEEISKKNLEDIEKAKNKFMKDCDLDDTYQHMIASVKKWNPPVDGKDLKDFVIEQLEISRPDIKFRARIYRNTMTKAQQTDDEVKAQYIKNCDDNIEYHKKNIETKVKDAEERTKWMKDLLESLKELE